MEHFVEQFRKIKLDYEKTGAEDPQLICTTSTYLGCHGVKLHKNSWGSPSGVGIFFSVWIEPKESARYRVNYNIHALKVRQLKSYVITSRDFAEAFRRQFSTLSDSWPNVRVDYGPLNLMQGWIELRTKTFERDVLALMKRFKKVSPIIDRLLAERLR